MDRSQFITNYVREKMAARPEGVPVTRGRLDKLITEANEIWHYLEDRKEANWYVRS